MITITLFTADDCIGRFTVDVTAAGDIEEGPIVWGPHYPEAQTDYALLSCPPLPEIKLSGDRWRALEDEEDITALYRALASIARSLTPTST